MWIFPSNINYLDRILYFLSYIPYFLKL
jgi:hypothetical protein